MLISAKFPGVCTKCGAGFPAGEQIEYGKGTQHAACPPTVAIPTTVTRVERLPGVGSLGPVYVACGDRTDEFLARAAAYNKITTDDVLLALAAGKLVTYEHTGEVGDYDIRDGVIAEAVAAAHRRAINQSHARHNAINPRMRCRSCGTAGNRGSYPFSTNPSSGLCDDCGA